MINGIFHFRSEDALLYGVDAATILYNLRFWVKTNMANKTNFHQGYYWHYNSVEAFCEFLPFYSPHQIRRSLEKLEKLGAIKTGNYNIARYDRKKWYTVIDMHPQGGFPCDDEPNKGDASKRGKSHLANLPNAFDESAKCISQKCQMLLTKKPNAFDEKARPITDINPDTNPNKNPAPAALDEKEFTPGSVMNLWNDKYLKQAGRGRCDTLGPKRLKLIEAALKVYPHPHQWDIILGQVSRWTWVTEGVLNFSFDSIFEKDRYCKAYEEGMDRLEKEKKLDEYAQSLFQYDEPTDLPPLKAVSSQEPQDATLDALGIIPKGYSNVL